jgi:basic membrane protein A
MPSSSRRRFTISSLAALAVGACAGPARRTSLTVGGLFAGKIDDAGFMEAGYRGLVRARDELGVSIRYIDQLPPQRERLLEGLRELARGGAQLVVAQGGQNNEAARAAAAEFPATTFVVTQGNVTGPNLASYEVLQEESSWLAGAACGLITRTGVVSHMSGIRVVPGLKARAAFADGVRTANPQARLLTNFSGTQDDGAVAKRIALAMFDQKADILYTMLNAGRGGAIEACRERGVPQIGNVRDWVAAMPDVFIGSAVADSSIAFFDAVRDFAQGSFKPGTVQRIGLANPDAVRLVLGAQVAPEVKARIAAWSAQIVAGSIHLPDTYSGPEFQA